MVNRYLGLITLVILMDGTIAPLRSQPALDVTRIDVDFPTVILHTSVACGGTGVPGLAWTNFTMAENGVRIADLYLLPKPDSAGKYLLEYSLGCCTIDRFLLVKVRNVPGCAGEDSIRTYYRRPPPDTTTYWPVQVSLGNAQVRGGEEAVVPLLLDNTLAETLSPSSFLIRFDTGLVHLSSVDTKGKILEQIPVTFTETAEGAALYTHIAGVIQGAGTLADLHFTTRAREQDTEVPLRLSGKLYIPCSHTVCFPGKIVMLSSTTGVERQGTDPGFNRLSNFPNPFADRTTIQLRMTNDELRQSTIRNPHSEIRLTVYDLLGREVLNVSSGISPGGEVTIQAEQLPGCGVYLYRLIAGSTSAAGTMVRIPIRY